MGGGELALGERGIRAIDEPEHHHRGEADQIDMCSPTPIKMPKAKPKIPHSSPIRMNQRSMFFTSQSSIESFSWRLDPRHDPLQSAVPGVTNAAEQANL
jgi:hypothetical protein